MSKMIVYTKPKLYRGNLCIIIQPDIVVTQLILFDNFKLKLCEIFYIPYFVLRPLIMSSNTSYAWSKNHLFLIMLTFVTLKELHARALQGDPHS